MAGKKPTPRVDRIKALLDASSQELEDLSEAHYAPVEEGLQNLCAAVHQRQSTATQTGVSELSSRRASSTRALFFNHLNEAALVFEVIRDEAGHVIDWLYRDANTAALQSFGVQPDEFIGKKASQLYDIDQLHQKALEIQHVLSTGEASQREESIDDQYFQVSLFKIDENTVARLSTDITEQKHAEASLQIMFETLAANEAGYQDLAEIINDGFLELNQDWCFTFINQRAASNVGLLPADLIGKNIWERFPALCGTVTEQYYRQVMDKRQPASFEIDGVYSGKCYDIRVYPSAKGISIFWIDITERKRTEEELRKSEVIKRESEARERARANEIEALMDAAPAVIWISRDPKCEEMIGNRYSYDFLRIGQGENVSKTAQDKTDAGQHYQMQKDGHPIPVDELPMQIAAATGKATQDYSFELVYQDGTVYHMFGNVNPLFDRDGKPYGAIGVFIDFTTLHRLEEEKIVAKAAIEVQNRLMDQREQERQALARDLHDGPIQTLSSTTFYLQMIKDLFSDPALHVELNQVGMNIKASIQELRGVLYDLRPPALIHFGFSQVIQMYTQDLRERYPNIEIEMEVLDDDDRLLSDQARLALFRIYQAGINNILRHSGASKAWVVYKIQPDRFFLEMRDNGIGFELSKDYAQLTREGHFGLVGMKERTEAIGGEFSATSAPGKGTSIVVKGPLNRKNLK